MTRTGKLKLTPLGEFVNRHSTLTPVVFWRNTWREVNAIADDDGEWEFYLEERIAGLTEMRDRFYELNAREVGDE